MNDYWNLTGGYLMHHGVRNQKWGVRNGPPYPLSYKKKRDANLGEKSGRARWKDEMFPDKKADQFMYKDSLRESYANQKGTFKSGRYIKNYRDMNNLVFSNMEKLPSGGGYSYEYDNASKVIAQNLDKFTKNKSSLETVFRTGTINPNYGERGTTNNCPFTTAAAALNAKGYNVSAALSDGGAITDCMEYYFDKPEKYRSTNVSSVHKYLMAQPEGSYGAFNGHYSEGGGHFINWEKRSGKIHYYDNQSGKSFDSTESMMKHYGFSNTYYTGTTRQGYEYTSSGNSSEPSLRRRDSMRGDSINAGFTTYRLDNANPNWSNISEEGILSVNPSYYGNKTTRFYNNINSNDRSINVSGEDLTWDKAYDAYKKHW